MGWDSYDIGEDMKNNNVLNKQRRQLIAEHVRTHNLIELQCDYLGMDSYYYDGRSKIMYKVCNICDWSNNVNPTFEISNDIHILQLNGLN